MNVLVLNLGMDVGHTALGFTTSWTNALARRCDHVSVIAHFTGELELEPNVTVYSLGKERGFSEPRRLLEFYRLVNRMLREREIDVCFAHMAPLFAVLFAPIGKLRGIRVLLWYAHGSRPRMMRLAHRLADRVVTPSPTSFTLRSDKVHVIGHGVDVGVFRPPEEHPPNYDRTAISIGRLTGVKRVEDMLAALALVRHEHGIDLRLELTGGPLTAADDGYVQMLRENARSLGLEDAVSFAGPVPFNEIPARYHHGSLLLHLSESSALDKALLEGMASGCIPISRNESFREIAERNGLGSLVPGPGPEGLSEAIVRALGLSPAERVRLVQRLREIVEREHGLDPLADKLIEHLSELAR